ncbi:MAG: DUF6364 family protein [Cyclobacteriaceae bacterium]
MNSKLTLNVDSSITQKAKEYAKSNKISLSKLIESYLSSLVNKKADEVEITPLVEKLSGVIEMDQHDFPSDDYADFLAEKYK